ncbi:MAG: type II secretion system protein N [Thermodesulfobacteriota bacterium]
MKILFTILNLLFITTMAYCLVDTGYNHLVPQNFTLPGQKVYNIKAQTLNPGENKQGIDENLNNIIVKRNLFKVEIEQKEEPFLNLEKEENESETLEPTKLKLVLWGTVTGQENVYAVIEDKKLRKQALYQIGDLIQGAELKKILRNKVILLFQGENQFLEVQTNSRKDSGIRSFKETIPVEAAPVKRAIEHDATDDVASMMRKIKFRPHFSEGEPDGLMVYGIRPNSVFSKIGLRNGDIIKDVNGTVIVSKDDISNLFDGIEDQESLKLTLFRRGKVKELTYTPNPYEDDKGEEE